MSKKEVGFEGTLEIEKAAEYLEQLAKSMREGKVVVEKGDDFIVLNPAEVVEIEAEAAEKKGVEKFSLKLKWKSKSESGEEPDLKISSSTPIEFEGEIKS